MKGSAILAVVAILAAATPSAAESAAEAPGRARLLATDDVHDCAFARDGTLVAATSGGLVVGARVLTALDGLPDTRVLALEVAGDDVVARGASWAARVALNTLRVRVLPAESKPASPATASPDFELVRGGVVRRRALAGPGGPTCIATSEGLFVASAGLEPARVVTASLPSADVAALAAGDAGTLFVGTFDRGLVRVRGGGARIERIDDGALNPNVNALAWDGARRTLWVATARGLTRCTDAEPMRCRRVGDARSMHAVVITPDGHAIAGGDGGLVFAAPDGEVLGTPTRKGGTPFRATWSLALAPDGTLFAGTTTGIYWGSRAQFLGDAKTLKRAAMVDGALPDDWVTALAFRDATLFAGTYNAGLVALHHEAGALTRESADASLGYVNPAGITLLPRGEIAVATMDGLRIGAPFGGGLRAIPTLGRDVTAVAVDAGGARWVASRRGVARQ